jgi:hypothetical protein
LPVFKKRFGDSDIVKDQLIIQKIQAIHLLGITNKSPFSGVNDGLENFSMIEADLRNPSIREEISLQLSEKLARKRTRITRDLGLFAATSVR